MSEFKIQDCMFALTSNGVKDDSRLIYFYEDEETPAIWYLKQGISDLGWVEKGNPTKDMEKPFCDMIEWLLYHEFRGVVLNKVVDPRKVYFQGIYSLSNFLGLVAYKQCSVIVRDANTRISLPTGNTIEGYVRKNLHVLYELFNGRERVNAFCRELTKGNSQYNFSLFMNVDGILSLFCQNRSNPTDTKIVEIKYV